MQDAGVRLLAGADAGSSWVVYSTKVAENGGANLRIECLFDVNPLRLLGFSQFQVHGPSYDAGDNLLIN
jgi:hypothetical protein